MYFFLSATGFTVKRFDRGMIIKLHGSSCKVPALLSGSNLLKPTGHGMHQQFNIQQLYVLPTLYLCVL